jgi:hypothetical protein
MIGRKIYVFKNLKALAIPYIGGAWMDKKYCILLVFIPGLIKTMALAVIVERMSVCAREAIYFPFRWRNAPAMLLHSFGH